MGKKTLFEKFVNTHLLAEKNKVESTLSNYQREQKVDIVSETSGLITTASGISFNRITVYKEFIKVANAEKAFLFSLGSNCEMEKLLDMVNSTKFPLKTISLILEKAEHIDIVRLYKKLYNKESNRLNRQEFLLNYLACKEMSDALRILLENYSISFKEDELSDTLSWVDKGLTDLILAKTTKVYSSTVALMFDNVNALKVLFEKIGSSNDSDIAFYQKNQITLSDKDWNSLMKRKKLLAVFLRLMCNQKATLTGDQIKEFLKNKECENLWAILFYATPLEEEEQKIILQTEDDELISLMISAKVTFYNYCKRRTYNDLRDYWAESIERNYISEQTIICEDVFQECLEKRFVKSLVALNEYAKDNLVRWSNAKKEEAIFDIKHPDLICALNVDDNKTQLRILRECNVDCLRAMCSNTSNLSHYVSKQIIKRNDSEELLVLAEFTKDENIAAELCEMGLTKVIISLIKNFKGNLPLKVRDMILQRDIEDEVLLLEDFPQISEVVENPKRVYTLDDVIARKKLERLLSKTRLSPYEIERHKLEFSSRGVNLEDTGIGAIDHPFPTGHIVLSASSTQELSGLIQEMICDGWHCYGEHSDKTIVNTCDNNQYVRNSGGDGFYTLINRYDISQRAVTQAMVTYRDSYIDVLLDEEELANS